MHTVLLALAQQGEGGGGSAPPAGCGGGSIQSLMFMVLMFAVFYFILIRPQQKRAKEHANLLAGLKKGDEVITRGGVIGRISGIQDNVVTLEIQEKVRIRILRSYIEGKHAASGAAKAESPKPAETQPPVVDT